MSAFTTDPFARSIHGKDPQNLIEKIAREKVRESRYWSEKCFGLDAASLIENCTEINAIGGMFSEMNKPTDFVCLLLKMLQIQPAKDVVVAYIKNEDMKYLRALGAIYFRMVGTAKDIYDYLEPLLNDYRKLRYRARNEWEIVTMDAFVDQLLNDNIVLGIALPHLLSRLQMEDTGLLEPRKSPLEEYHPDEFEKMLQSVASPKKEGIYETSANSAESGNNNDIEAEDIDEKDESEKKKSKKKAKKHHKERHSSSRHTDSGRSRSYSNNRRSSHHRSNSPYYRRDRSRSRSRSRSRGRDRYDDRDYGSNSRDRYRHRRRSNSKDRSRRRADDESDKEREKSSKKKDRMKEEDSISNKFGLKGSNKSSDKKSKYTETIQDKDVSGGGKKAELSIEETNKLRLSLGLKPLKQ